MSDDDVKVYRQQKARSFSVFMIDHGCQFHGRGGLGGSVIFKVIYPGMNSAWS